MKYAVDLVIVKRSRRYIAARSMREARWQLVQQLHPDEASTVLVTGIRPVKRAARRKKAARAQKEVRGES